MGYAGAEKKNHLFFDAVPLEKGKKMPHYRVINTTFDEPIGLIHWRGGWRQYVFCANPEIDMSRGCMKEVSTFIDTLMESWKNERRKKVN